MLAMQVSFTVGHQPCELSTPGLEVSLARVCTSGSSLQNATPSSEEHASAESRGLYANRIERSLLDCFVSVLEQNRGRKDVTASLDWPSRV